MPKLKTALKNNTGLLWFDDNPGRTLTEKIQHLARHYRQKFGHIPNLCYVHVSTVTKPTKIDNILVHPARNVSPNYLWIGQAGAK